MGYIFVGLIKLLGLIPFATAQRIGHWLGRQAFKRPTTMRAVAEINIAMCYPELSPEQQRELVQASLCETGMLGAEMGVMWGAGAEKGRTLVRRIHNLEIFTDAIASGKGVLFNVPHLGNWEILNHVVTQYATFTALYKPAKNKVLDRWMRSSRQKTGCIVVPTNSAGIKAFFLALTDGQVAGILPDQEPKERSGVFAPFMGVSALTPKLPHELLMKTGARAVFGFAKRLPQGEGFDVYFFAADEELYSEDLQVSAASMNRTLEAMVRLAPEQYQWTYKRFRRRPDGAKNPYRA